MWSTGPLLMTLEIGGSTVVGDNKETLADVVGAAGTVLVRTTVCGVRGVSGAAGVWDDIAPVLAFWFWIWDVFITADTANLALSESNVNLEVGCEEKECSKPLHELLRSEVSCLSNCSCCARVICRSCSWWDWKLSMLNSVISSWAVWEGFSWDDDSSSVGECGRKCGLLTKQKFNYFLFRNQLYNLYFRSICRSINLVLIISTQHLPLQS